MQVSNVLTQSASVGGVKANVTVWSARSGLPSTARRRLRLPRGMWLLSASEASRAGHSWLRTGRADRRQDGHRTGPEGLLAGLLERPVSRARRSHVIMRLAAANGS
jgi:hypothetical protein